MAAMRSIIASAAFKEHPDITRYPVLECKGKCRAITPHEFSHLELEVEERLGAATVDLMYRCDTCNKARRWGSMLWNQAVEIDPEIAKLKLV